MRIGIDACCWSNRRGFGRFTREIVTHMVAECPQHEYTLVVDRATAAESRFPPGARVEVVATREQPTRAASAAGARSPLDLWRMARAARLPLDVFFFPAVYSYYPMLRRIPTVVTFHDAIAENHPELIFPRAQARLFWTAKTWLAARQASRIMTVSKNARARIASAFRIPEGSIHVIVEGPGDAFRPISDPGTVRGVLERYGLPRTLPLILYVGGISPHKNLDGLLHAMARLQAKRPSHLAIVGDHAGDSFYGCYPELVELRGRLGLESKVTFTGFVPDEDLAVLYNAATVLAMPSFDEGFGLPAVEAMACGLPVAASRQGSLSEVLGPVGVFFDPRDHGEMAAAFLRLLEDPQLRRDLAAEGLRRAQLFSWSAAARDTVRLFEETVAGRSPRAEEV